MPAILTSLAGAAVVATVNRCLARRLLCAVRSCTTRSTRGRQVAVNAVGMANTASRMSAGWIDISNATVTTSRRIHPHVENTDMYMWSSTNTWFRSMSSRSR